MSVDTKKVVKKWEPVLNHDAFPAITDPVRRSITAQLLENTVVGGNGQAILSESDLPSNVSANFGAPNSNNTTNISGIDPIIINMVRRTAPLLMAYDVCGVQPMTMPSGLVFALRAKYISSAPDTDLRDNTEAWYNEPDSAFSGSGTQSGSSPSVLNDATPGAYTYGSGMSTSTAEALGTSGNPWKEMGLTIEKVSVVAKERAIKTQFTTEMRTDLKTVHGLDADAILTDLITTEVMAELNREVVRTIYTIAKPGAQNTAVAGTFDLDADSNGRWSAEKFMGILFQIDREANIIARETRVGKGNVIIASADVVSALMQIPGIFDTSAALQSLEVDEAGNTFAGVLRGRYKVYVDPFSGVAEDGTGNYFVVGLKGKNPLAAGLFYCPYVPLQRLEAVDPQTLHPIIGYKTRYGMVASPFAGGASAALGQLVANTNVFYRRVAVKNLEGAAS